MKTERRKENLDNFDKKIVTAEQNRMTFEVNCKETFDTITKHLKCRKGDMDSNKVKMTITVHHPKIFSRIINDLQVNEEKLNILIAEN